MNGNFKYSMTDEQRNKLHNRLTGTNTKKLASRADVCEFLKSSLDKILNHGTVIAAPQPVRVEEEIKEISIDASDFCTEEVELMIRQNELLLDRVNTLQHRLDIMVQS